MIFIDTSHLIGVSIPNDEIHDVAMAWSRHVSTSCMTTEFVLLEFLNAMSSPLRRRKAVQVIAEIERDPTIHIVRCDPEVFRLGVDLFSKRQDKEWSLTDCISFRIMESAGITDAFTSDTHFEQAGYRALLRQMPPAN